MPSNEFIPEAMTRLNVVDGWDDTQLFIKLWPMHSNTHEGTGRSRKTARPNTGKASSQIRRTAAICQAARWQVAACRRSGCLTPVLLVCVCMQNFVKIMTDRAQSWLAQSEDCRTLLDDNIHPRPGGAQRCASGGGCS